MRHTRLGPADGGDGLLRDRRAAHDGLCHGGRRRRVAGLFEPASRGTRHDHETLCLQLGRGLARYRAQRFAPGHRSAMRGFREARHIKYAVPRSPGRPKARCPRARSRHRPFPGTRAGAASGDHPGERDPHGAGGVEYRVPRHAGWGGPRRPPAAGPGACAAPHGPGLRRGRAC